MFPSYLGWDTMSDEAPICLTCQFLTWNGFLAHCSQILFDDTLFEEASELAETRKFEGVVAARALDREQDEEFEQTLAYHFMAIPYMVWRRKGVERYDDNAPRTADECPFGYRPLNDPRSK
jgi:hypothetical protein